MRREFWASARLRRSVFAQCIAARVVLVCVCVCVALPSVVSIVKNTHCAWLFAHGICLSTLKFLYSSSAGFRLIDGTARAFPKWSDGVFCPFRYWWKRATLGGKRALL